MSYSQNSEDLIIENYFNGFKGVLLDIGANEGETFSNSRRLILQGWGAVMFEPSPSAFNRLSKLYKDCPLVAVHCVAISDKSGMLTFYESGAHVPNGNDISLVSTLDYNDTIRWRKSGVQFNEIEVVAKSWADVYRDLPKVFDFITIDAESMDWQILQQIDLTAVGCRCLCIEWNSKPELAHAYTAYCLQHGLTELHRNAENIIFCK